MLEIQNLNKKYKVDKSDFSVLTNLSLTVSKGDFIAIMGRSGCGKTTLLNILGLIDTFNDGSYFFDGQDISALSKDAQARFRSEKIGFIFQSYNLLQELNCSDNISLTLGYAGKNKKMRNARAAELLELIGLTDKRNMYPNQLSGGQQQRIAIARALSNNPSLILADEPTGNLDYQNGLEIMKLLKKLNEQGTTILMVTHDAEFSQFAKTILHMKDGVFINQKAASPLL